MDEKKLKEFDSGMKREDKTGKIIWDLIFPVTQNLENTYLYRCAMHLTTGAEKHGDRNWEKASGENELESFRRGAFRHFMQFMMGKTDEDHAAAVFFNINGMVYTMDKLNCDVYGRPIKKPVITSELRREIGRI